MSTGTTWAVIVLAGAVLVGLALTVDAWLDHLAERREPQEPECPRCGHTVYDAAAHAHLCAGRPW